MKPKLFELVQKYAPLFDELEARETVLRMNFNDQQRMAKFPFSSDFIFDEREDELLPILIDIDTGLINEAEALNRLNDVLLHYYGE